jgi:hypothetical protein
MALHYFYLGYYIQRVYMVETSPQIYYLIEKMPLFLF